MRCILLLIITAFGSFGFSGSVYAFGSGAGTCTVVDDFSTITGMQSRTRNQNTGGYELNSPVSTYNSTEHVEITLSATGSGDQAVFTGVVVSVVDDNNVQVGTFDFNSETEIRDCGGSAMMAATHTSTHGSVMSRTLFWIPPAQSVGDVHILAYVLSGSRGDQSSQQFYRLVQNDGAVTLTEGAGDVIFANGFE